MSNSVVSAQMPAQLTSILPPGSSGMDMSSVPPFAPGRVAFLRMILFFFSNTSSGFTFRYFRAMRKSTWGYSLFS
ncbi:MAG: hypothetical protein BWY28_01633 [bacterium ADurb.Bin236]|nr:MAG: hypothetical protein BWY28_01633 [bacterium ADurb.Bin236]